MAAAYQAVGKSVPLHSTRLRIEPVHTLIRESVNPPPLILGDGLNLVARELLCGSVSHEARVVPLRIVNTHQAAPGRRCPESAFTIHKDAPDGALWQSVSSREYSKMLIMIASQVIPVEAHPKVARTVFAKSNGISEYRQSFCLFVDVK